MSEEKCITTFDGIIKEITITQIFYFTLNVAGHKISCIYDYYKFHKKVNSAFEKKRKVSVSGMAYYKKEDSLPYKIEVSAIEVYPSSKNLPDFDDLKGIAPNSTGGLSSEDFVKKIRCEWE